MTGEEAAEILRAAFARQARERAEYEARAAADRAELDAEMRRDVQRAGWVRVLAEDELYRHPAHEGDHDLDTAYGSVHGYPLRRP